MSYVKNVKKKQQTVARQLNHNLCYTDYHVHLVFMRYPPNLVNFSWLTASFLGQRSK